MSGPTTYLAEGKRVAIRPLSLADADEFTTRAAQSRELHHPWLAPPTDPAAFAQYATRLLDEPSRVGFLVCTKDDGALAGYVSINNIVHGAFRCGALGYGAFAHAAGRGLMTEGLRLVIRHAFGALDLHRLEINVQPENAASLALARRLGFRYEGHSPDFLYVDGAWRGHDRLALTSDMLGA